MVDHGVLFRTLRDRGLPLPILRFMLSWYATQQMQVRWGTCLSDVFHVSNGVRQGSVLSPVLFAVYLDGLLAELSGSGVGCYWGSLFAGAFCYADDIVLLAPCASALRTMLDICSSYAVSHGLEFNANKTQLICFYTSSIRQYTATIFFENIPLQYSEHVTHLGHILSSNLNDKEDIVRVVKDMNRKANTVLCTFGSADPFVKCFLIKSFCLSLYGCTLWSLSSSSIKIIEVALNKILRKVWNLPHHSHTAIIHCVALVPTICNLLYKRFCSLYSCALSSSSLLVKSIFTNCSQLMYTFSGYNHMSGHQHLRVFNDEDYNIATTIRHFRHFYGLYSPCEDIIKALSCD